MSVQVQTRSGRIEGEARGNHLVFRGIPFAKPPVGALRFRPPEAPEPWSGVRSALSFGPAAPQSFSNVVGMSADGPKSEDCLYLNVYTKGLSGKPRPVQFWIHGGAFSLGTASSAIYDGGRLCERGDTVVVTTNYRLGALGYAYLGAHGGDRIGASANLGQLDQIAALRWVRDNIEAFGGDPDNVTIFGESAGSMAVSLLLVMPEAKGLFVRAIAQSGASVNLLNTDGAAKVAEGLFAQLDLQPTEVERLLDVPAERIVEAQAVAARDPLRGFAPIHDGATIPLQPIDAITAGQSAAVPLMIGTNRDEWNLFAGPLLKELDKPLPNDQAVSVLARDLPRTAEGKLPAMLETYRASRQKRDLPHSNRALLGAIQGDLRFRIPSIRYAEAYRAQQPGTFMYLFEYESPAMRGALRACHALEIPFVFGTLDAPLQDRFAGKGPAVEALSEAMMDSWQQFAKTSHPTHPRVGDWLPYDTSRRATMVFDTRIRLEDAPLDEERAAWDGIVW